MKENEWESVLLDAGAAQREEKKKKELENHWIIILW